MVVEQKGSKKIKVEKKWRKVTKTTDEANMRSFFVEGEEPLRYRGGFKRDKLLAPWDDVCLVLS